MIIVNEVLVGWLESKRVLETARTLQHESGTYETFGPIYVPAA
jgi:hypothetical protein